MKVVQYSDIAHLAESFPAAREYIDACLTAHSPSSANTPEITTDSFILQSLLADLSEKATEVPLPDIPEPPIPIKPDLNGVKQRHRAAVIRECERRNADLRSQYAQQHAEISSLRAQATARNDEIIFQRRVIERLHRDLAAKTINGKLFIAERLNWIVLESGSDSLAHLKLYYTDVVRRRPELDVDFSRIERVHGLVPRTIYMGINEFDGYIVFLFRNSPFAVLECPIVGNALYLIHGDWMRLSRLSKSELLRRHSENVDRIIHGETWFNQLKQRLTLKGVAEARNEPSDCTPS